MTDGDNPQQAQDSRGSSRAKPVGARRVVHVTCSTCSGPRGFANLVMRKLDGRIELDPHATGACVIRLGEDAAVTVRDQLGEWPGR